MPKSNFSTRQYVQVCGDISPDGASFKTNESQIVMHIRVRADDVLDCVREILGYSTREIDNSTDPPTARLIRYLPWQCPMPGAGWLWAVAVPKVQYMGVASESPAIAGRGSFAQYQMPVGPLGTEQLNCELTVVFGTPTYDVRDEAQLGQLVGNLATARGQLGYWHFEDNVYKFRPPESVALFNPANPLPTGAALEYFRYVEKYEQPSLEFLDTGIGTLKYAQASPVRLTGPLGVPVTINVPPPNTFVPFGWKKKLYKSEITLVVRDLPYRGVYDALGNLSQAMFDIIGCVNQRDFWGKPKGTLLVHPPKITPRVPPVDPSFCGFNSLMGESGRAVDMEWHLSFFDPPWNKSAFPADNAPTPMAPNYRGWNLLPQRGFPNAPFPYQFWHLGSRNGDVAALVNNPADPFAVITAGTNTNYQYADVANGLFTLTPF
jgi:hypothetical protein